jgi:uncharacterized protein (TIGR03437 family)
MPSFFPIKTFHTRTHQHLRLFPLSTVLVILALFSLRGAAQETGAVAVVSAASFEAPVSAESIVAAFGAGLATTTEVATTLPLPTVLGGTSVSVTDSNGTTRAASLFFVSPGQINCVIPTGTASGNATFTVMAGNGAMSVGTVEIAPGVPAIFTANVSGVGAPAANLIRVHPDASQSIEIPFQGEFPDFIPRPIDLGPENELVFLILYATGLRAAPDTDGNPDNGSAENVRVLIGGIELIPAFAGPAPGFVGLEQINVAIPRDLIGARQVSVTISALGFQSSNDVDIDIAGPQGLAPIEVSGVDAEGPILARDLITILGSNLPTDPDNMTVRIGGVEAGVEVATPNQTLVRVPFGVIAGAMSLSTTSTSWMSEAPLPVRTSISGYIRDTRDQPLPGVNIRLFSNNASTQSTAGGWFVLPDAPNGAAVAFAVEPPQDDALPFPTLPLKMPVFIQRDNQYPESIFLQPATGPAIPVNPSGSGFGPGTNRIKQQEPDLSISTGGVTFKLPGFGVSATFPDGSTSGSIVLDVIENSLTPVRLPKGVFSSAIIQLTPFGVKLEPGGQLIFPNPDGLPPGTDAYLYALDLDPTRQSFGRFVNLGPKAKVSADGAQIETDEDAIIATTIYFVAVARPLTTIIGRVLDFDERTPVRGAIVRARGQQSITDGFGGFVLRNVPTVGDENIDVTANKLRSTGRIDRAEGATLDSVVDGLTKIAPLILSSPTSNRPPYIYAPTTIIAYAGMLLESEFLVRDLDSGQQVADVRVIGPGFVSLADVGNSRYRLRVNATTRDVGSYQIAVTATDTADGARAHPIQLLVKSPPTAQPQSITVDEDKTIQIVLTGSDPEGRPLVYRIKETVKNGRLLGTPPVLNYTPLPDFNGSDSFTFTVDNGLVESAPATVSITINPVNDPPSLTVPGTITTSLGNTVNFTVTASDPDAGQTLTLSAMDLPIGSMFNPATGVFNWTPTAPQVGTHVVTFRVTDNAQPPLSDMKTVAINVMGVGAWTATSGPDGGTVNAFLVNGAVTLIGTEADGVFRSTNNGASWIPASTGLDNATVRALILFNSQIYAGTANGVYRSSDNGVTWTLASLGLTNGSVRAFGTIGNTLFAGTDGGVFGFTGSTWTPGGLGNLSVRALAVIGELLYAGTANSGVFQSTNLGGSWTALNPSTQPQQVLALAVRQTPNGSILYAGTQGFGVYALPVGGNWTSLSNGMGGATVRAFATSGNLLFAATGGFGVFRFNFAATNPIWTQVNDGLTTFFTRSLLVNGSNLFVGTLEGGVFRSINNGDSWTASNQGLPRAIVTFLTTHGGGLFAAANGGGLFSTADEGQSWTPRNNGLVNPIISSLASSGGPDIFAGSFGNGVFRSTNNGVNWSPVSRGLNDLFVQSLLARNGALFAGTQGGGVFRAASVNDDWTAINNGLTNGAVFALAGNAQFLFAGTRGGGVFRSANNGNSWSAANQGLTDLNLNCLLIADAALYAGTQDGGVFRSTDNGATWTTANQGIANLNIQSMASTGGAVYAATLGGGVYFSTNGAMSWNTVNIGLGNLRVLSLATMGNALFAGTDGGGVFVLK